MPVRILIADDHERTRSILTELIRGAGWLVCGAVADGKAAVEKAAQLKPDVLILDFIMPNQDGISAGRLIRTFMPEAPLLLYTMFSSPYVESEAKRSGFHGVVEKANGPALIAAIRRALGPNATTH
jgi:CheY-like chemotaxis protein